LRRATGSNSDSRIIANKKNLKYQSGRCVGFLDVYYEDGGNAAAGDKPGTKYVIYFELQEYYHRPE
jgi:hypothetical protein